MLSSVLTRTRSRVAFMRDVADRKSVERHYRENPPPITHGAKQIFLVEGLWDNPNHWLRLWVFLHAYLRDRKADVIGILRSRDNWDNWRKRKSLEALGIRRFVYLDDAALDAPDYAARADILMQDVIDARDIFQMSLPDELPGYVYFDTVLKAEQHPQPRIDGNPVWRRVLAELLHFSDFYRDLFQKHDIVGVVSSHAWKSEWGALCWTALRRNVPFYYMTAHYDSIRIRKMQRTQDYRAPNEHLPFADFSALPEETQRRLIDRGRNYLSDRFAGNSDFLVLRYAIDPAQRGKDRFTLVSELGLDPGKPIVAIYTHSWFDFPHTQAMRNFTEPLDWVNFTVDTIKPLNHINWIFKPHPCDQWYGTIRLQDILTDLPLHVAIVPEKSDSLAIQSIADAVVTIQGSIAIEAAAMGKPVLCADRSTYTDWGFSHTASSREDYARKLQTILDLPPPTTEQSGRAMAFAATALAPPPQEVNSLKLACDTRHLEGTLYSSINSLFAGNSKSLDDEILDMVQWLQCEQPSYNVWKIVSHCASLPMPRRC